MKFSERDRRALLAGTMAVALVLLYAGGVRPFQKIRSELIIRRDVASETLQRYRELAEARPAYAAAVDTVRLRLEELLAGVFTEDPQKATNRLVETLERASRATEVRILRAAPLPPDSAAAGMLRVGASLECESDLAGLLTLLHALEKARRIVHVSGLRIRGTAGTPSGAEIEVLRAGFTVSAFVLAPPEAYDAEVVLP